MPEKIGRYKIKAELGRGGMAAVYHGYDPRFQRDVAIKVLPPEFLQDPTLRPRFQREARTIAALEHPAIVAVYDVGEEEGLPYLVMRFMTGGSLTDRLEEGPLAVEEIARIIGRIGSALDEAHKRGVIHRDLKPGNILFDQYGEAFLSDFGIARSTQSQGTLTGAGGAMGTPGYMSPEQIQGEEVDNRSDIYALGILVFEMLTGQNPFKADSPAMAIVRQMTEPVPPIRQVKPDLPPEVDTVIKGATAKKRADRTPTASEVANLLAQAAAATTRAAEMMAAQVAPQTDEEQVARTPADEPAPETAPSRPTTISKRQPGVLWLVGGAAVALLIVALVYLSWRGQGQTGQQAALPEASATTTPAPATPTESIVVLSDAPTATAGSASAAAPTATAGRTSAATPTTTATSTTGPTATPRPTSGPTATMDADPTVYDNFNNPAYDGKINTQRWRSGTDTDLACDMRQEDGTLITTGEPADEEAVCWVAIRHKTVPGRELKTLSARMKIASDHNGGGTTSIIRQLAEHHEVWCGFGATEAGALIEFTVVDYRLGDYRQGDNVVLYNNKRLYTYDQWYDVRLEVDPATMTFSCLVDGEEIGRYSPENVAELQNTSFHWRGLLDARAPGAQATTFIDDVRIGQLEPDVVETDPTRYDYFDDPAYDDSLNLSLWQASVTSPNSVQQENGELVLSLVPGQGEVLNLYWRADLKLSQVRSVEAKMLLSNTFPGNDGDTSFNLITALENNDELFVACFIYRTEAVEVGCEVYRHKVGGEFVSDRIATDFDTWHTVRIEVDPEIKINFYVDGQSIGTYRPADAIALKDNVSRLRIDVWSPQENGMQARYDEVRIGQPESIAAIPPTSTSAPEPTPTPQLPTSTPVSPTPLPGVETIPLAGLAAEIPWLPLDEQAVPATHSYYFNVTTPPFDNPLVRQAFALAVDREAVANLARDVGFSQARPATTFTHPNTLGRDLYPQVGLPFDPLRAQATLAQAGYPNGQGFPPVTLFIGPSPAHEAIAGTVIGMWRDNLGIEVGLQKVGENFFDYVAYLESEKPALFRLGWGVDYNDPNNTLNDALHSGSEHNMGQFASAEFDRLVEQAAGAAVSDPAARQRLYIQAERILTEQETAVIPLFHDH